MNETTKKLEVVSMFSYKGGVGRTYLTAQLARILAALGKKVVIFDWDMDAPSIPGVFDEKNAGYDNPDSNYGKIKGGFYNLVSNYAKRSRRPVWNSHRQKELDYYHDFKEDFEKYLIDCDVKLDGTQIDPKFGSKGSGWIKILPGGKVTEPTYWDNIASSKWLTVINDNIDLDSAETLFENAFKPALKEIGAEYLLIDCRAGITHYGGLVRRVANRQIMIVTPTDETKRVLGDKLIKALFARMDDSSRPKWDGFVFAVGRVPYEYADKERQLFLDTKKFLEDKMYNSDLLTLAKILHISSDIETYYDPFIRVFDERYLTERNSMTHLHEDILKVFAASLHEEAESVLQEFLDAGVEIAVPEDISEALSEDEREMTRQAYAVWQKMYGYPFDRVSRNVVFEEKYSIMYNIEDNERNVAFKVDTFLNLLCEIEKNLGKDADLRAALNEAGKECGNNFGKALLGQWGILEESTKASPISDNKLKEWCKFDTRTGFGRMTYESGALTIAAPFVVDRKKGFDYSIFLNGYVKGVLDMFGYEIVPNISQNEISDSLTYRFQPKVAIEEGQA